MMQTPARATHDRSSDDELREAIRARVAAVRTKDADAMLAGYASDVMTFDLIPPMRNAGAESVRKRVMDWFESFATPIEYETKELELFVDGNVAFDHHLTHVSGTNKAGAKIDMWFRETMGYRKVGGKWQVIHQHSSVPIDMTTGKPLMTL